MKFNPLSKNPQDKSIRRHMLKKIDNNWSDKKIVPPEVKSKALAMAKTK